jgi:hypothetical protein
MLDTDEHWIDIARDRAPSAEELMAFLPAIKTAIAEDIEFERVLCTAMLLPAPDDVRGLTHYNRCARKYRR